MYHIFVLFVSILFLSNSVLSQSTSIQAVVVDAESNLPLEGCEILCGSQGTITDAMGQFSFDNVSHSEIQIQHIGFESLTLPLNEITPVIHLVPITMMGESVKIYGALTTQSLIDSESGISVISQRDIRNSSQPHFQALINSVPNLNWAGGSSRPRYFQIRGIGERSQYAGDGPPNFSVGLSVDDLDLSGIGMAGMTFDVDRVELFRGPQSSIYGPNALAGFIVMRSVEPGEHSTNFVTVSAGSGNTLNLGVALDLVNHPALKARMAFYRGYNNGFRKNEYLNKDNTNERQETMSRLNLIWQPASAFRIKTTLLNVFLDNGYDGWSPDNSPYTTYTDKPGKDSQKLFGGVVNLRYDFGVRTSLNAILSRSEADIEHSYDSDWGNDDFWSQEPYSVEGWSYDYFDLINRDRETMTQELRLRHLSSGERIRIILGAYHKSLTEQDDAQGYLFGGDESSLLSEFLLNNQSFYGQFDFMPNQKFKISTNFRVGVRNTDYNDDKMTSFAIKDQLNGGKLALLYKFNQRTMAFVNAARGFKAGGINQHPRIIEAHRPFKPEYVNNFELGYRGFSRISMVSLVGFYTQRMDQQVSLSSQQDPSDPNSFTYYIGNASSGYVTGLESEFRMQLGEKINLSGTLGLLKSQTDEYSFEVSASEFITLGDREFAHAPKYSYRFGADYILNKAVSLSIDYARKDAFYFSESHDQMSKPYQTLNSVLTYRWNESIMLTVWADNVLNTQYATRGFYFGLEPPNYEDKLYMSYADPRQVGATLRYTF